ncbi:hypothetical protein N7510_004566 [Penicillium lagena]|uniref:uncharacterized protein n=1 Tax=Penicillium lagena TaxID=94218 RepID=UPI00253F7337|nr:uncharacterized protein N7510_004566 [Penicillium lagena]KAJ5620582.1 hypothetical protein N7510_004566 [Penicillium lagena]
MEDSRKVVVIASENVPKIRSTREGFRLMLPGSYDFQSVKVDSGVPDQPFSDDETLQGAINRARNAKNAVPGAEYWVGIEGGVEVHSGAVCCFAWIVVNRKDGQTGKARTSAFFVAEETARLLHEGMDLGKADDKVLGQTNVKDNQGSVGILTGGLVDRADYYTQAVILALIPFKNPSLKFAS